MINSVKARTPILALILFVFAVGYTFAANKVVVIPMAADAPQSRAMFASGDQLTGVGAAESIREILFTAPSDGVVIVNSSVAVVETTAGDSGVCSITTGIVMDYTHLQQWESSGTASGIYGSLSGTRGFDVTKDSSYVFNLICQHLGSPGTNTSFSDSSLTAIFTPSA